MKKIKKLLKNLREKFTVIGTSAMGTLILAESRVFAASNTGSIDEFINFACDWLTKIGGVIALVGGVMFALRMAKRRCRRKIKRFNDTYGWFYVSCDCTI